MEQKAAQVFSQQEQEQQTRDLKQQDTKLNALTKEEGNVPLSGVAVRKGPKCRISTTKKNNSKRMNRVQRNTHYRKYKTTKKKIHKKQKVNHRTTNRNPDQLANRETTHRTICTQSTN